MKYVQLLCLLVAASLTTSRIDAQQAVNVQDSLALVDFYDSNNGPGWHYPGWKQGPVSTWHGVTVTDGRVTELSLSFNGITLLPASFGNLTNLNVLYLAGNQLSSLPASFEKLKNLQSLNLFQNQLSSLPESFGNLVNLRSFDLGSNQLSSLPASFGKLKNLQSLSANYCQLSSLSESFGNLANLKYLELGGNQLSSLPESFGNLANLNVLQLGINQLRSLPESFGNFTNLWRLNLSFNQLGSLPASLGNLTKLLYLELTSNQLRSLPESFGNLTNLLYLNLSYNQLGSLPASFGNLKNLQALELGFNQLSSLPESFGNLTNFSEYLGLNNNKFTFEALEWVIQTLLWPKNDGSDFPSAQYDPQDTIKLAQKGNTLIAAVGGTPKNNTFSWYRDNVLDTIIQADSTYTPTKAGAYRVEAHNAIATKLTLYSNTVHFLPACEDCITTWYRDADGDGFGDPHLSKAAKEKPRGYVSNKLDCDDKNKTVGGPEVCDGRDNDCDGIIDNGFDRKPFYSDWDGDGYGSPKRMKMACVAPPRYVSDSSDLNDDNATVYPGAPELCDGRDNDQNGIIDDGLPQHPFYWDHDKDGYGFFRPVYACAAPRGYISVGGDFNDNDPTIHPGAIEHCDGVDEDCDGIIDNGFPQKRFYKDKDGDGWGSLSNEMAGCAPPGYVEKSGDCNDNDASIHPGAAEIPGNGIDDNCNGQVDEAVLTITTLSNGDGGTVKETTAVPLQLSAIPNPSQHYFNLRIESRSNKPIQLRIVDEVGRVIEMRQGIAPNSTIPIGNTYRAGVYYAQALQEGKLVSVKLVKQAE